VLATAKDIVNTMLWPSVLMVAARAGWLARGRGAPPAPRRDTAQSR
jgi:hypothetical protein